MKKIILVLIVCFSVRFSFASSIKTKADGACKNALEDVFKYVTRKTEYEKLEDVNEKNPLIVNFVKMEK
tara:strand:+ start:4567 stop:4773 length:207 start_codon:yes stop_codon:yes gene_type:complete